MRGGACAGLVGSMKSVGFWAALGAALVLSGCGLDSDAGKDEAEEEEEASPTAVRLVGRVVSVHETEGFALVERLGAREFGRGLILSTTGPGGRTATLVASGEQLGRHAAADLKSGDVAAGDAVYARPLPEPEEPGEGEIPAEVEGPEN